MEYLVDTVLGVVLGAFLAGGVIHGFSVQICASIIACLLIWLRQDFLPHRSNDKLIQELEQIKSDVTKLNLSVGFLKNKSQQ
jgi:hypothetical protein